ncbi:type II toxin-antitoxin system HigB family toxin [Salmonirosea aquatica]|uniref:Type II toxin-antitoxin system HigB family toxin n=1 Tax=Salmonirosea aquatica TaxID=2654236 RepID=A0A7C9F5E7_9BACT|nr:type II toxin-antitoxin system HigB family toxin [Cytophagaceae bacterium SJW1-29]
MRVHALKTLKSFWNKYPDSEPNLRHWYGKIEGGTYANPQEVIMQFKGANYVGNERIVFNIARNKYRLIVSFNYGYQLCFVKFVGTHKEYDRIDAKTIDYNP